MTQIFGYNKIFFQGRLFKCLHIIGTSAVINLKMTCINIVIKTRWDKYSINKQDWEIGHWNFSWHWKFDWFLIIKYNILGFKFPYQCFLGHLTSESLSGIICIMFVWKTQFLIPQVSISMQLFSFINTGVYRTMLAEWAYRCSRCLPLSFMSFNPKV